MECSLESLQLRTSRALWAVVFKVAPTPGSADLLLQLSILQLCTLFQSCVLKLTQQASFHSHTELDRISDCVLYCSSPPIWVRARASTATHNAVTNTALLSRQVLSSVQYCLGSLLLATSFQCSFPLTPTPVTRTSLQ